ncbi:MAG: hypothetical protein GXO67_01675 [Archaeoglobi archaeon]|nr:hypothetical protein [Archaeoglobi archaeon]
MKVFLTLWGVIFVALSGINMAILSYAYGGFPDPVVHIRVIGLTIIASFAFAGIIGAIAGITGNMSLSSPKKRDTI